MTFAAGPAFGGFSATDLAVPKDYLSRIAALRAEGRKRRRGQTESAMSGTKDMIARLRKSVEEIAKSDVANRDELLAKTFSEFEEAVEAESQDAEEPVGSEGDEDLAEDREIIDEGESEPPHPIEALLVLGQDEDAIIQDLIDSGDVSDETAEILATIVALRELALRSAASDQAVVLEDEDELEAAKADGLFLLEAGLSKADGEGEDEVVVATALPESLHHLITDNVSIGEAMSAVGLNLAKMAGVPVEEALAKFADEEEAQAEAEAQESPEEPTDPVSSLAKQIQVLMRLNAAALVQGEAVMRGLTGMTGEPEGPAAEEAEMEQPEQEAAAEEGGEEPTAEEPAAEEGAERAEPAAAEAERGPGAESEPKKKNPFDKADGIDGLAKSITDAVMAATAPLQAEIERLKSMPAAPKAPAKGVTVGLKKTEDGGGISAESEASRLMKLSPEERAAELLKMTWATNSDA